MISYLDKLNLRPAEKRLVVVAVLALFVVVNFIFVVPRFGEWGRIEQGMKDSRARLDKYQSEVSKQEVYKKELERLRGIGQSVPLEDQALDLSKTVTTHAALSGVSVQSMSADRKLGGGKTNLFFEEKTASITLNASEQQLVDFLYLLGSGDSLIRAKNMSMSPDPTKMRLNANLTLVASYQKRPVTKASSAQESKTAATNVLEAPVNSPFKAPPARITTPTRKIGTNVDLKSQ